MGLVVDFVCLVCLFVCLFLFVCAFAAKRVLVVNHVPFHPHLPRRRRLQTQVVQRGLPIPKKVNEDILRKGEPTSQEQQADEIIKQEMLKLLRRDRGESVQLDRFEEEELLAAKQVGK